MTFKRIIAIKQYLPINLNFDPTEMLYTRRLYNKYIFICETKNYSLLLFWYCKKLHLLSVLLI